jgi:hypothetical protein
MPSATCLAVYRLGESTTECSAPWMSSITTPVMVVFPVVMPWLPVRMMLVDPFRVMVEPPVAVAPIMMVVPVAIFEPPLVMVFGPFGMMLPEPSRMVIVPPVGVVPPVMFVEVASFTMFVGARSMR